MVDMIYYLATLSVQDNTGHEFEGSFAVDPDVTHGVEGMGARVPQRVPFHL